MREREEEVNVRERGGGECERGRGGECKRRRR